MEIVNYLLDSNGLESVNIFFDEKSFPELLVTEAAFPQRCFNEKVSWKYAANLKENIHAELRFQFLKIHKYNERYESMTAKVYKCYLSNGKPLMQTGFET